MSAVPPFPAPAPRPPFRAASARRRFSRRWAAALAAAVLLALLAVPALTAEAVEDLDSSNRVLTAEFEQAPTSHDGATEFTFRVRFSEAVATSYAVLRDDAFELKPGTDQAMISGARRVDGSSAFWEITVQPRSEADLLIVLPRTTNCEDEGAVCTSAGKMLSERTEALVAGPPPPVSEQQVGAEGGNDPQDEPPFDEDIVVVIDQDQAPGVPTGLAAAAASWSLKVTWEAPTDGGTPTGYNVRYKLATDPNNAFVPATRADDDVSLSQTIGGLNPFTDYHVQVQAQNSTGFSAFSSSVTGTPNADITLPTTNQDTPMGLHGRDGTLFVLGGNRESFTMKFRVHAYTMETGAVDNVRDFRVLLSGPVKDFCTDGSTWWIGEGNNLRAYIFSQTYEEPTEDSTRRITATGTLGGVWCEGTRMYQVDGPALRAWTLPGRTRSSSDDIALGSTLFLVRNPAGVYFDGIFAWVTAPESANFSSRAYAYTTAGVETRAYIVSLGDRDNDDPAGIWSNGTIIWVADKTDNKIYSYPVPAALHPPKAQSAAVSDDGMTITMAFDQTLDTGSVPAVARFAVRVGSDAALMPASVAHTSGNNRSITLTMSSPIRAVAKVNVAYTDPDGDQTSGVVERTGLGYDLRSLTALAATPRPNLESVQLVSNFDQDKTGIEASLHATLPRIAQSFRTGRRAGGYTLNAVTVRFADSGLVPTMTIRSNDGGSPGSVLYTLSSPPQAQAQRPGDKRYAAPPGAVLERNTTYFVDLASPSRLVATAGTSEVDSPAAQHWSLPQANLAFFSGNWIIPTTEVTRLRLKIEGTGSDGPIKPGLPTDVMLTTPRDRVLAASWTAPTDGATTTGYELRHKPSAAGNSAWGETSTFVTSTSRETPDLRPGRLLRYPGPLRGRGVPGRLDGHGPGHADGHGERYRRADQVDAERRHDCRHFRRRHPQLHGQRRLRHRRHHDHARLAGLPGGRVPRLIRESADRRRRHDGGLPGGARRQREHDQGAGDRRGRRHEGDLHDRGYPGQAYGGRVGTYQLGH